MREKIETIDFGEYRTPIDLLPSNVEHTLMKELREAINNAVCVPASWLPSHVVRDLKHGRENRGRYSLADIQRYCERMAAPPVVHADMDKIAKNHAIEVYQKSTDDDGNILSEIEYDVDEFRQKLSYLAFGKLMASWAGKSLADYIEE